MTPRLAGFIITLLLVLALFVTVKSLGKAEATIDQLEGDLTDVSRKYEELVEASKKHAKTIGANDVTAGKAAVQIAGVKNQDCRTLDDDLPADFLSALSLLEGDQTGSLTAAGAVGRKTDAKASGKVDPKSGATQR